MKTVPWSTSIDDLLSLLEENNVDGFIAKKVSLRAYGQGSNSLFLKLSAEWFKSIIAIAEPVVETGEWKVKYAAIGERGDELSAEVALAVDDNSFTISRDQYYDFIVEPAASSDGKVNVLRMIVKILERKQHEMTFTTMLEKYPEVRLVAAALQPHYRFVSGYLGERKFVIELGRMNPEDTARVTLHRRLPLRPARFDEIYHIKLSQGLIDMKPEELAVVLLGKALDEESNLELAV